MHRRAVLALEEHDAHGLDAARVQLNAVPGVLVVHDGPELAPEARVGQPHARAARHLGPRVLDARPLRLDLPGLVVVVALRDRAGRPYGCRAVALKCFERSNGPSPYRSNFNASRAASNLPDNT